jgi:DNA-binding winged helix-turn-helix (wHTH) protein/Tol biopolymer transport system component
LKEKHLYSFGEFILNVEDQTLSRVGGNVPLTPKMFDLLLVLVQNPGKVLRKEFLLETVWPNSFVEEGNITYNVRQLRKALEDDAQSPTYIETIPRRGYRFIPAVEAMTTITPDKSEEEIEKSSAPVALEAPVKNSRPYVLIATTAILILCVLIFGGWLMSRKASASAPILSTPFSLEKLSKDGRVNHAVITPDGKSIVYTYRSSGKQGLWLRQLDDSSNVPIIESTTDNYGGLAVAPDGKTVYFTRFTQGTGQGFSVYRMSIFGGVPQRLVDQTQGWISLSSAGDRFSFVRCYYTDQDYCSLFVADASDGQNEKKLVTKPRPIRIADNKISPDGKSIAFASGQSWTASNEFTVSSVDIETGVEKELSPERFFNINYVAWLPNNDGLLVTALQNPERTYRIWRILPDGKAVKLTTDSETYSRLSLDASATNLVATQIQADFHLMLYNMDNPSIPFRTLADAGAVAFGNDGKLYFSSERTGDFEIWSVNADGSDERQLTNEESGETAPIVSPDNRYIYFESNRSGKIHVWRMNTDGTNQKQITTDDGGFPIVVSPDGAWLYYRSGLNNTLRRVAVETGQEELVMEQLGRHMVVSPDTTLLAYSQRKGTDSVITVMSLADRSVVRTYQIPGPTSNVAHLVWSGDGKFLAYILTDERREAGTLWFQTLGDGSPKRIADLSGDEIAEFQAFAISNDGKSFAVIKGMWKHDAVLLKGLKR